MNVLAAFIRGINVGSKNQIKMADLKQMFEAIGLSDVKTYIKSGNVIFKSTMNSNELQILLEDEIEKSFGFRARVVVRTDLELQEIIRNCPFSSDEIKYAESLSQVESLYVSLMSDIPSSEGLKLIEKYINAGDQCVLKNNDLYMLFQHSIRESKLANNLVKLNVVSTVRNWNTLLKISEMASEIIN